MRAVLATDPGGPETLQIRDIERPTPDAGEVLIKVRAAGMNRADLAQREGRYPPPAGVSDVLGLECSGYIAEIGAGVQQWSVGEPCVALLAGGGYAEYVAVPAGQVLSPPPGMDLTVAAGVVEVAATVVSNLDLAALRSGETFLVHGGSGGIGSFAIPYAKALGARVLTTAGSAEKLDYCRGLGADIAIDYHDDWPAAVADAISKSVGGAGGGAPGCDVILDVMGAKYLEPNVDALGVGGRLVVIGLQGGAKATLNLAKLLSKRGSVHATSLRYRPVHEKARICQRLINSVWPLYAGTSEHARLTEPTHQIIHFDEVSRAHALLESGASHGKLILSW